MIRLVKQTVGEYLAWTNADWSSFDGQEITGDHRQRTGHYTKLLVDILHHVAQFNSDEVRKKTPEA